MNQTNLAEHAGLGQESLSKLLGGKYKSMHFDLVDKLFSFLGLNFVWVENDRLNAIYYKVDLSRPLRAETPTGECLRCGKTFKHPDQRKLYCTRLCKDAAWKMKMRERRRKERACAD